MLCRNVQPESVEYVPSFSYVAELSRIEST